MEYSLFALVLIIGAASAQQQTTSAPMKATLVSDATVVPKGSWAHMVCYVPVNFQSYVVWLKNTGATPTDVKIATNQVLESVYKPITRYSLYLQNPSNRTGMMAFHFNITSTLPEDTGNYSCSIAGQPGTFSNTTLIVMKDLLAPEVTITNKHTNEELTIVEGDVFTMEQGVHYDFRCDLEKANPVPLLNFTGDAAIHRASASSTIQTTYTKTTYPGLDLPTTTVARILTDAWLDVFGGLKQFACNVSISPTYTTFMRPGQQTSISTRFSVQFVEFTPVVNCTTPFPVTVGSAALVRCYVTGSTATLPTFSWLLPDKRNMSVGSTLDGGVYSTDAKLNPDTNTYYMDLSIKSVTDAQLSAGAYTFSATNSKGVTTSTQVTLTKASPSASTTQRPGAAVGGSATKLSITVMANIIMFLAIAVML